MMYYTLYFIMFTNHYPDMHPKSGIQYCPFLLAYTGRFKVIKQAGAAST